MDLRTLFARVERNELENYFRSKAVTKYCGDSIALTRVLDSFNLFVDTKNRDIVPHLMMDGFWEIWVTQALVERVKHEWYCVEVGFSYGYYAMLMKKLTHDEHETEVVEDLQERVRTLFYDSVEINGANALLSVDVGIGSDFFKVSYSDNDVIEEVSRHTPHAQLLIQPDEDTNLGKLSEQYTFEEVSPKGSLFQTLTAEQAAAEMKDKAPGALWLWLTPK